MAELQLIYSVMDSGVDGWQGLTGKLEGKILINHYDLIIEIYVRSSTYDSISSVALSHVN